MLGQQKLSRQDGAEIAYYKSTGCSPGIVFIHGLMSDMTGEKACGLERLCKVQKRAFVRFDCFGHGQSSGDFCDGTVGRWVDDTVAVLESLTDGPQVLVGSSIGGWVALLAALRRPERVSGFVGVAVAADFTEEVIWRRLSSSQRSAVMRYRVLSLKNGDASYRISKALIEDGRKHLLLKDRIAVTCPIRLIHGLEDKEVPWQTALRLQKKIVSSNLVITLIKDGSHRLSRPQDIERIVGIVAELLSFIERT